MHFLCSEEWADSLHNSTLHSMLHRFVQKFELLSPSLGTIRHTMAALALVLVMSLGGCLPWGEKGTRLAKVKDHTLTLEELQADGVKKRDSVMQQVVKWVDQEVLVQQAYKMGIHLEPRVVWLLRDAERKILLDAYYSTIHKKVAIPEEGELELHYDRHKQEYLRDESWMSIYIDSQLVAPKVDSTLDSSSSSPRIARTLEGPRSTFPNCMLSLIDTLTAGELWSSVQCGDYTLQIRVRERRPQGGAMPFSEARQRVYNEVYAIRKQKYADSLLVLAKAQQTIYTWPENLPNP